jgi:hypothetical protein
MGRLHGISASATKQTRKLDLREELHAAKVERARARREQKLVEQKRREILDELVGLIRDDATPAKLALCPAAAGDRAQLAQLAHATIEDVVRFLRFFEERFFFVGFFSFVGFFFRWLFLPLAFSSVGFLPLLWAEGPWERPVLAFFEERFFFVGFFFSLAFFSLAFSSVGFFFRWLFLPLAFFRCFGRRAPLGEAGAGRMQVSVLDGGLARRIAGRLVGEILFRSFVFWFSLVFRWCFCLFGRRAFGRSGAGRTQSGCLDGGLAQRIAWRRGCRHRVLLCVCVCVCVLVCASDIQS